MRLEWGAVELVDNEIQRILAEPNEHFRVEFKEAGIWLDRRNSIVKAAVVMANVPEHCYIIVGLIDKDHVVERQGLTEDQLATYKSDVVMDFISSYMRPVVEIVSKRTSCDGLDCFVIRIGYDGRSVVGTTKHIAGTGSGNPNLYLEGNNALEIAFDATDSPSAATICSCIWHNEGLRGAVSRNLELAAEVEKPGLVSSEIF